MGLFVSRSNDKARAKAIVSELGTPAIKPAVLELPAAEEAPPAALADVPAVLTERQSYLSQMRVRVHQQLVERLDVQNLRSVPIDVVRHEVRTLVRELCQSEK